MTTPLSVELTALVQRITDFLTAGGHYGEEQWTTQEMQLRENGAWVLAKDVL